jgi:hypothetical protein
MVVAAGGEYPAVRAEGNAEDEVRVTGDGCPDLLVAEARSQSRIVPSLLAAARVRPFGLKATPLTEPV